MRHFRSVSLLFPGIAFAAAVLAQSPSHAPSYAAEQAKRGEAVFQEKCATCHGDQLDNGEVAPPLKGGAFLAKWGGKGLDEPFAIMSTQMPPTEPGALGADTYAAVLAFVLSKNGVAPGSAPLPSDPDQLKLMTIPKQ